MVKGSACPEPAEDEGGYMVEKGRIRYLDVVLLWCYHEKTSFTLSFPEESSPDNGRHGVSFPYA
jgi:hypothetical protein